MLATTSTTTVLNYAIAINPDPLQVSTTASITIVAAKHDRSTITYNKLTVKVVVSSDPSSEDALTTDAGSITLDPPPNWTPGPDGELSFMPQPGYGNLQPDDMLMFVLSGIQVNNQVGTTTLTLVEEVTITNSDGSQTPSTQSVSFQLGKFPQGFELSELTASKPILGLGDTTALNWTGSPGNYTLQYGSQSVPIQQQSNLAPYSYPISNLPETTTFILSVETDGGNVTAQRQYTITVLRPEILSFEAVGNVTELRTGQPITLSWQTVNATSCDLYINGVLIATGLPANSPSSGYMVNNTPLAPGTTSFVLIAYGTTSTQFVRAVLPIFMYRFELLPQSVAVGWMPYQLALRPDGARLYVACFYPYTFGQFSTPVKAQVPPATPTSLYMVDTYNFSSSQFFHDNDAYYPVPDQNTQCITRLAIHPQDAYRFYFCSAGGFLFDCTSQDGVHILADPQIYNAVGNAGMAGTPQIGSIYPVIATPDSSLSQLTMLYLDCNQPDFQFLPLVDLSPLPDLPASATAYWALWNIVALPQSQLITFSVAAYSTPQILRMAEKTASQVSFNNLLTGGKFPPAVASLTNSNALYCVSGVDTSADHQPVIVIMGNNDQEVRRIPVPAEVRAVVASPDGYHIYASLDDNTIIRMQIGAGNNQVIDTISNVGIPWALAINPEGTRLYVGDLVDPTAAAIPNGIIRAIEISDGAF